MFISPETSHLDYTGLFFFPRSHKHPIQTCLIESFCKDNGTRAWRLCHSGSLALQPQMCVVSSRAGELCAHQSITQAAAVGREQGL